MIVIALGANLPSREGAPEFTIRAALRSLDGRGITVTAVSFLWRTPAWPNRSDPPFVNAAAIVATTLAPEALLTVLHDIETQFGRVRSAGGERNAPRTLDLDLIDYNGRVQAGPPELPHPRMHERAFVLMPLADVALGWRHPVSGKSIDAMVAALPPDQLQDLKRIEPVKGERPA